VFTIKIALILLLSWFGFQKQEIPHLKKNTVEGIFLAGACDLGFLCLGYPVVFLCLQNGDNMS